MRRSEERMSEKSHREVLKCSFCNFLGYILTTEECSLAIKPVIVTAIMNIAFSYKVPSAEFVSCSNEHQGLLFSKGRTA